MMTQWENRPIVFEDPEVKRICVENFGGENGIINKSFGTVGVQGMSGEVTYRQVLAVSFFGNLFKNNNVIRYFNELEYFKNLKTINDIFNGCSELIETTISKDNQLNGIANNVFKGCKKLRRINNFNAIKKLIDMENIFNTCESLEYIDFTGIDMSELRRISFSFAFCSNLKSINFGNANFSQVVLFNYMFNKCGNLEELLNFDKDTFGVSVPYNESRYFNGWVFNGAKKLVTEDFIMNVPTNMSNSIGGNFFGEIDVKYIDLRNYINLKSMSFDVFPGCPNIEGATLPNNTPIVISGTFFSFQNAKFNYNRQYIRFLSETPPEIRNYYSGAIPVNWYVPANSIQAYRDYINSINSYFGVANKIILKPLDDWESDCDTFGWTKY